MTIRASGKATLSFGLVAIPCKLYLGAAADAVGFNTLAPSGARVKQQYIDPMTGDEVPYGKGTKGYEFAKGRYVTFSQDEIDALGNASGNGQVGIAEFVPLASVDHRHVEKTYYLGPDKGGDKAYQLLAETLEAKQRCAVAQWGTKGRTHLVLVRAWRTERNLGLVMHQLFYADEVRDVDEVFGLCANMPAHEVERDLASKVVDQLGAPAFDASRFRDTYRDNVMAAINQKVAGAQHVSVEPTVPQAQIVDLFEALKKSLNDAGTPMAGDVEAAKPKAKAKKPRKRKAG
ncbi:MAG TPA: Ku protein [Myxococcota bacterium]